MEKPLYTCWCKATRGERGAPRVSHNWLLSRRAWFQVYRDRVSCGDWTIPYGAIENAIAYRVRWLFFHATVLHLSTNDGHYQFGFNPWADPVARLGIAVDVRVTRIRYSLFSIALRVALVAGVAAWLWLR